MGHCNYMCYVPRATLTVETTLAWIGAGVLVDVDSRSDVHTHSQQVFTEYLSCTSRTSWPWGFRRDGDTLAVPLVISKPYS